MSIMAENSTVPKLIDVDTGSWNLALINSLFHTTDVLYWPMCIDGSYSVKACYRAMCEEDNHTNNTSSNAGLSKRISPKLWKLR